ncbi:hypothetical protein HZY97_08430 [Sphingomonas sp. R-74633]|uniref:hypothetical protein n=1 Tax=Sphingomonas sp. R-74633 TaxID=2751188 RepID=UPI0015D3943C|nr:hypothetical protein [Sphingomonas sp. R-74633]NYT40779.1 hypothetical protein [Sphingomonas sp. R-74633]
MKLIGWILLASLVIAAAQAIAVALMLVLLVGVIWGFCAAPRETFALLSLCIVASMAIQQPILIAGLAVLVAVLRQLQRR